MILVIKISEDSAEYIVLNIWYVLIFDIFSFIGIDFFVYIDVSIAF